MMNVNGSFELERWLSSFDFELLLMCVRHLFSLFYQVHQLSSYNPLGSWVSDAERGKFDKAIQKKRW